MAKNRTAKKKNPKIIDLINNLLSKFFSQAQVNLVKVGSKNEISIYNIKIIKDESIEYQDDDPSFIANDLRVDGNNLSSLVLHIADDVLFLIGLELKLSSSKDVINCSILVYSYHYSKVTLLFRAEWAKIDDNKHAQPHWHFEYPTVDNAPQSDPEPKDFESSKKFTTATDEPDNFLHKIKDFHFAMNANWHKASSNVHQHPIQSAEELATWIKNTIEYIKQQIEYSFK